ncbi:MAG: glycosyltransferase [bacterium]|nr:glycosyltransferase [bacterium]
MTARLIEATPTDLESLRGKTSLKKSRNRKVRLSAHSALSGHRKISPEIFKKIDTHMESLKRRTVIHINSTAVANGGGVAELLRNQIPFERALGLNSRWLVLDRVPPKFFDVSKKIHNLLQGEVGSLTNQEKKLYLKVQKELGESLRDFCEPYENGVLMVHDPQPAGIIDYVPSGFVSISRIHIDLTSPNKSALKFFQVFFKKYDEIIVHSPKYRKAIGKLGKTKLHIVGNNVNPLSMKNKPIPLAMAKKILANYGIDTKRPIVTQVSRFDLWKDPIGVIEAYEHAKNSFPDLQLVFSGFIMARDDPQAFQIVDEVKKRKGNDKDIHIFYNPKQLKACAMDTFINALYTASDIIMQKSIREGFGITMTEAMWHGKPLIAGRTAGALLQVNDGTNGIIVGSRLSAGHAIAKLLSSKKLRDRLGRAAHISVKKNFILSGYILNHLQIYKSALR